MRTADCKSLRDRTAKLPLLVCAIALHACSPNLENHCPGEWSTETTAPLEVDLPRAAIVRWPRVKTETIAAIHACYSRDPLYNNPQYQLYFAGERRLLDGNRILIFDIAGVSDIEFGVVVGADEAIRRAGVVSLNF